MRLHSLLIMKISSDKMRVWRDELLSSFVMRHHSATVLSPGVVSRFSAMPDRRWWDLEFRRLFPAVMLLGPFGVRSECLASVRTRRTARGTA